MHENIVKWLNQTENENCRFHTAWYTVVCQVVWTHTIVYHLIHGRVQ